MPTILSHAVSGLAIGSLYRSQRPRGFWVWSAVCAMLPDADVISFALGIGYGHLLGHRGLSHSLAFAALVGAVAAWKWGRGRSRLALFVHFFVVTASHGFLDAFTNGGLGVAFFAPFDDTRYFFPWRPIQVSPIGAGFFTARDATGAFYGIRVLASEFWYVWMPSAGVALGGWALRTRRSAR
ncbi:MAG TPA: metal-dependent hydrolase [Vicinamibacterales bacterium]|jgi:inner membrane protein